MQNPNNVEEITPNKSTGPKTEAGKLASSQNAIKHGLFARQLVLLPGETQEQFDDLYSALKAEHNLASRRDVKLMLITSDSAWTLIEANLSKLLRMAGASEITRRDKVDGAPATVTALGTLYLDLASSVDVGAEKARMTKEIEALAKHIAGTEARLANQSFVSKAPPAVLEGARKQLADQKAKSAELQRLLNSLG